MDDQRLLRNPLKIHKSVKAPRAKEKKAKASARTTVDTVREQLQERYRFAVYLGLGLGLHQGEAFGLAEEDFDFTNMVVRIRRQLRWDTTRCPYFCLPKGGKTREVPLSPNLAARARAHFRRFPSTARTRPWRNPEPPTNALEKRQRRPITVRLVLTASHGNRIYYKTWNERSWRPALAAVGLFTVLGEKVQRYGGQARRYPVYASSRADTFHVLRHT
ncbi:hypothetical protein [Streptomyces qinzhouensis]|uniref:hypothetical protein n=1 Tax=Streptomyces qinzhouensis TaxID=2599401 RepID=UPI001FE53D9B|nr:hypothetical protein [Streptomyces qinzhouensis]